MDLVKFLVSFEEVTFTKPDDFDQTITNTTKHLNWEKQVAFITLWQFCSKPLKTKLMGHPNFDKEQKQQNPVWILQAIQSTLYHFDDTKPVALALDDAMEAAMFC